MNRRGFLSILGGVAALAALDPERLLWVPGAKTISVPAAKRPFLIRFDSMDPWSYAWPLPVSPLSRKPSGDRLASFEKAQSILDRDYPDAFCIGGQSIFPVWDHDDPIARITFLGKSAYSCIPANAGVDIFSGKLEWGNIPDKVIHI